VILKRRKISMLLIDAKCGDKVKIKEFLENEAVLKKIEAMGLRKGDIFEVVKKWGRNYLLINGNNRIIVSYEVAKNIEVELIERDLSVCEEKPSQRKRWRCRWRWGWFK